VLQIRQLLEELAGLELQTRTTELRQLEIQAEEHRRMAAAIRSEAMTRDEAAADFWLAAADAEILLWKSERIGAVAQRVGEQVAALGERRMIRRMERKQAEIIVSNAAQDEAQERIRREQQRVDDWYQSLPESRRSG
jgi:hypothetical protein